MTTKFVKHEVYSRDPFFVDPLPKAHYHPSRERQLTKSQRAISISPSRRERTTVEQGVESDYSGEINGGSFSPEIHDRLSPADELFLKGTNIYETKPSNRLSVEEPSLDETWPSSERPSSLDLTGLDGGSPVDLQRYQSVIDRFSGLKKTLNFIEDDQDPNKSPPRRRQPGSTSQPAGMSHHGKGMAGSKQHQGNQSKTKIPVKGSKKVSQVPERMGRTKTKTGVPEPDGETQEGESVLQRYVDRFRNSAPLSREEREKRHGTSSKDFWWLQQDSKSVADSFPPPEKEIKQEQLHETSALTTANLDKYKRQHEGVGWMPQAPARSGVPQSPVDKRTIELQERADRLLERSVSTVVSTDPAVSTEGLGSTLSGNSSVHEYTYRPRFAQYIEKDPPPKLPPARKEHPVSMPTGPDDDILHQWRLRRRMEQAQQTAPKSIPTFGFLDKSEQERKIEQRLDEFKQKLSGKSEMGRAVSGSVNVQFTPAPQSAVQPEPISSNRPIRNRPINEPRIASPTLHPIQSGLDPSKEVDPHLHLMCDLLPCPHQGKYQGIQSQEQINSGNKGSNSAHSDIWKKEDKSVRRDDFEEPAVSNREQYKQYLEAEKPDIENAKTVKSAMDKDTNVDNSAHKTRGRHKEDIAVSEKSGEPSHLPHRTDYSPERRYHLQDVGDENDKIRERHGGDRVADDQGRETGHRVPFPRHSSSPKVERRGLEAAVGQVIKENLFNTSSSMVLSSVESLPPTAPVADRLPRKQAAQISAEQWQGEDVYHSDGDFPEDSLLQMLRKQRAQYEQQLQSIDGMLERLESR